MFPKSKAGTDESTSSIAQVSEKIRALENDAVLAIKNDLMVDFKFITRNTETTLELQHGIRLAVVKS